MELEQVTAIKFRARTPPWQAVEEGQAQGRQRRLVAGRPGGGAMDTWQAAQAGQTGERLEEVRHPFPLCVCNQLLLGGAFRVAVQLLGKQFPQGLYHACRSAPHGRACLW